MQRQSSIAEVASHLGITPNAVNECIESGLFLSTHSHNLGGHLLDKQECEWAWMQYTDQVANHPNVTLESLSRAVAYVKHLRVLILEEGSYFDGLSKLEAINNTPEECVRSTNSWLSILLSITLILLAIYFTIYYYSL